LEMEKSVSLLKIFSTLFINSIFMTRILLNLENPSLIERVAAALRGIEGVTLSVSAQRKQLKGKKATERPMAELTALLEQRAAGATTDDLTFENTDEMRKFFGL
jgi:hypothetical protein